MRRARAGFTLLEVLAVVLITGLLIASLTSLYVGIMRNTERATEATREVRVAAAVLDRVARDLEGAFVQVREEEEDPLSHPWLFKAESRAGQLGADRVLFTTLSHAGRGRADGRASAAGLATYAYWLEGDEEVGYDLVRWVEPRLAEEQGFPNVDAEGAALVAEGLAGFSLHFLDDVGNWTESWDSTALVDSSELPIAVEVRLQMQPPLAADEAELREAFGDTLEPREYRRRVVLHQRPLTREEALGLANVAGGGQDGADEDENLFADEASGCELMTWDECYRRQSEAVLASLTPAEQQTRQLRSSKCVPPGIALTSPKLDMSKCRR